MGALEGRVAIITGAGRGLGRAHALAFAAEGARVVVNDVGVAIDGSGHDPAPAEEVAAEVRAAGGEAVASRHDVADWEGGRQLVASALDAFGGLDIVVNNAGILRDRAIVNMTEDEWDSVLRVHVRGHFVPTRWAAAYWRDEARAGREHPRNLVHTSSTSGLLANPGQSNYGSAKSAIATFSEIAAKELSRYGVVSNTLVPAARTRLTEDQPGLGDMVRVPDEPGRFDVWDPDNVTPVAVYLASTSCRFNGATVYVQGGTVRLFRSWEMGDGVEREGRWSFDELRDALDELG